MYVFVFTFLIEKRAFVPFYSNYKIESLESPTHQKTFCHFLTSGAVLDPEYVSYDCKVQIDDDQLLKVNFKILPWIHNRHEYNTKINYI